MLRIPATTGELVRYASLCKSISLDTIFASALPHSPHRCWNGPGTRAVLHGCVGGGQNRGNPAPPALRITRAIVGRQKTGCYKTYCTQVLHLSEHAAYSRIEAAREFET